jgi:hypothetical protein
MQRVFHRDHATVGSIVPTANDDAVFAIVVVHHIHQSPNGNAVYAHLRGLDSVACWRSRRANASASWLFNAVMDEHIFHGHTCLLSLSPQEILDQPPEPVLTATRHVYSPNAWRRMGPRSWHKPFPAL